MLAISASSFYPLINLFAMHLDILRRIHADAHQQLVAELKNPKINLEKP